MPALTRFAAALGQISHLNESELSEMLERLQSPLSVIAGMVEFVSFLSLGNIFTAHVARNRLLASAAACAAGICSASAVFAMDLVTKIPEQVSQNSPSLQSPPDTGQQSAVFGDWGGVRGWLSSQGIDLGVSYLSESAWNVAGGLASGGTYAGQENVSLDLNWEKIASIEGFSTHIDFVSRLGSSNVSSKYVGDVLFQAQEIYGSPTVVQAFAHLAYFYLEEQLFNGGVDLKAGRIPVRNDFGTLPGTCFDFMSLSICANPSSTSNLSWTVFPVANWGGVAVFKISGPLSLKIGAYEVNPNDGGEYGFDWGLNGAAGVLIPVELDWNVNLGPQQLPGLYKIGGSYDTSPLSSWLTATNGMPLPLTTAPPQQSERTTLYVLGQQRIWQPDANSGRGITIVAGYEYNSPEVSLFEHFAFLGFVDVGPFPWRREDQAGFEVAYGRVSPFLTQVQQLQTGLGLSLSNAAPGVETDEIILEANYHIKLYPGLYVMPDLQYIIRPSAASTYPNAWVAGFRVSAVF
jgi:porin